MRTNNKITEAQILLVTRYLNRPHLTSDGVVDYVLVFGAVADMTEIVLLHAVPLNFKPKIKNINNIGRATMVPKNTF